MSKEVIKEEEVHTERSAPRLAPSRVRRVSWGAIFAGLAVTIVIQLMFTLLGASIGAATINPMQQQDPTRGLGIGSAIWLVVTGLISVWIGSCIAGRLSGGPRRADGMLHGIVSWSMATIAMVLLLASAAGAVLGGTGVLLGGAVAAKSSSNSGNGQNQDMMSMVKNQVNSISPQAGALLPTGRDQGNQVPGQLTQLATQDPELAAAITKMEAKGGAAQAAQERDQIVSLLTTKHGMNPQQADDVVNQWDRQFQQVKTQADQKARQVGDTAAHAVGQGSLMGFIALLLGLGAAAWGGWAGTASLPRPLESATTVV